MIFRAVISLIAIITFITSCDISNREEGETSNNSTIFAGQENATLDTILKRKKLRAVTDYGSLSYLIYRGEPIGYQYELLKDLTKYLNVELDLVIENSLQRSIDMLNSGEVDLLAMGLTVTSERNKEFSFTLPIMTTRQVLVQRKPDGYLNMRTADEIESHLLRNTLELANVEINVQKGTIFEKRLQTLSDEIADSIFIITGDRDMEELIKAVALAEIDYTVADEHIAIVNARYYRNIDVRTPLSFSQKISWAIKKGQYGLVDTINSWLIKFNKTLQARLLYNKYFKNIRSKKIVNSQYNSYSGGRLSPYDDEIKAAAEIIGWDWRLLASLVYQESEFKPNVRSWVGAYGLMQLMPNVLEKYGLDSNASPSEQLNAGVKHLIFIKKQIPTEITDTVEQVKFLLASYNCGLGHVLDARRLAVKHEKDPNNWTTNVDSCILNLSEKEYYHDTIVYYGYVRGEETFRFVQEIMERYNIYSTLIKQ
ncbi:MAG: lytic transglycosylase F [Bacteroidetes bacterium]|jgi:membrane-bound lytic murein transglycosylase F|nr:lytic transglycosylase F [Bacteroidota bacterium]